MESEQPLRPGAGSPVGEVKSVPEEEEVLGEESYACNQEVLDRYSYTPVTVTPTGPDSLDAEEPFCRICHEGGGADGEGGAGGGELLSPCDCSGTLATVHRACLERWLTAANSSRCELCLHQYAVERLTRPLGEWLSSPSTRRQRRTLCGDVVCFLFITPLASLSGWLCLQGALDLSYSNSLEAVGLLLLTLALFSIYLFWTLVSLRYHLQLVRTWRRTDQRVRLHLAPPAPAPPRAPQTGHQIIALNFLSKDASKETVV